MTSKELANIIQDLGLSQISFAKEMRIHPSTVCRWLSGETPIGDLAALAIEFYVAKEKGEVEWFKDS